MKLLSLFVNNFKKLNFEVPLEFRDGLTLISGLNESGKSSILDADRGGRLHVDGRG